MAIFDEIYLEFSQLNYQTMNTMTVVLELARFKIGNESEIPMINYVYSLLEQYNLFPDVADLKEEKSDAKSEELRQEGNSFFKYSKYVEALTAYNKSMCYAVSKDNLGVALANRSAALFKMEMFHECFESIQLLRDAIHPQTLKEKLAEREAKCKEEMKKAPKGVVFVPKIGMPVNEKIPFLAKCLELRENKTLGRHIVTTKDIPVGTIIAIEESFCKILGESDKYMRCATCAAEVPHRLLPCDSCTQTMFCSKECKKKASEGFHAIECEVSDALFKMFGDVHRLAIRMTISAFLAFPDIKRMGSALKRIEREKKTIFNFDWTKKLSPEELYTPIHTLIAHPHESQLDEFAATAVIFHFLKRNSPTFSQRFLTTKPAEDILKKLIFKHILTVPVNAHVPDTTMVFFNPAKAGLGGAIFGFRGLINHSCLQMTTTVNVGNASGILTMRNIAAGEQICANYDTHHKHMDRTSRQTKLLRSYFHCECLACVKDFPLLENYPFPRKIPPLPRHPCQTKEDLHMLPLKKAEEGFQMARDYILKYGQHYPIRQLNQAEMQLKYSLNIMCGNIPLKAREESRLEAEEAARFN